MILALYVHVHSVRSIGLSKENRLQPIQHRTDVWGDSILEIRVDHFYGGKRVKKASLEHSKEQKRTM